MRSVQVLAVTDHTVWSENGVFFSNSPLNLYDGIKNLRLIVRRIKTEVVPKNSTVVKNKNLEILDFDKRKSFYSIVEVIKYFGLILNNVRKSNIVILSGLSPITMIAWIICMFLRRKYFLRIIGKGDLNILAINPSGLLYKCVSRLYYHAMCFVAIFGVSLVVSRDAAKHYDIKKYFVVPDTKISKRDIHQSKVWIKNRLIYVGRLSKEKNLSLLADSLAGLHGVELIIVGDGPERNNFLEKLKENSILFTYLERLPHSAVLEEISKSQFLMMTSITEGLPNVIIEAFSVGTPVISTNVGGISEIVKDNVNGFFLNFNPSSNIEIISNLLNMSRVKYLNIRNNAIIEAKNFTVEKSLEKINEVIY